MVWKVFTQKLSSSLLSVFYYTLEAQTNKIIHTQTHTLKHTHSQTDMEINVENKGSIS